jgi:hypothetical protein
MRLRVKTVVVSLACVVMLAFAAPALATSPAQNAYGGEGATQNLRGTQNSQLPFTGFNVGLATAIGVALCGGGLVIRRRVGTR